MKTPVNFSYRIYINQIGRMAWLITMITIIPTLMSFAQSGWRRQPSGTTHNLLSMDFQSPSTGYVVGDSNVILRTTNSGQVWQLQSNELPLGLKDISIVGPDTAFAFGCRYVSAFPAIIRTYDGGNTWATIYEEMMTRFTRIRMSSATRGYISGSTGFNSNRVLRTYDGWVTNEPTNFELYDPEGHLDESIPFDMEFPDSLTGYIAAGIWDGDGAVAGTLDGGLSWSTIYWVHDYFLWGIDCPSIYTIFVVGSLGMIYMSTDMGTEWVNQRSNTDRTLYAVSFFDSLAGFAVGEEGTIVATTDGGESWSIQESGVSVTLRSVQMLSTKIAYVAGDSGTILFTRRGGWPPPGCNYVVGDINSEGHANGVDVTFGVVYFKGANPPPVDCTPPCTYVPDPFFAAGDVNGDCGFNGMDITFYVAYLRQTQPALRWCEDCPPN
jgi:photosystem II stability/assembly factor-like uncharacterized protein